MTIILITLSVALPLLSPIIYVRSILDGFTKPHRTTHFVLLLITTVAFIGLLAQDNKAALGLAFASVVQQVVIVGLSLRYGMGGKTPFDVVCLLLALLGVVWWQITDDPLVAVTAAVAADLIGCIPTLLKTYRWPHTEEWRFYALDTIAGIAAFLALHDRSFELAIYPAYITIINLAMVILIKRSWKRSIVV